MVFWGIFLQLFRFVVHNTLVVLIVVVVAVAVRFKIYVCWL